MPRFIPSCVLATFLLAAGLLMPAASPAATTPTPATPGPAQVVTSFHQALLGVMKQAKQLGVRGRYDKLAPVIKQGFHLRLMVQVASGSFWRKAGPQEKDL